MIFISSFFIKYFTLPSTTAITLWPIIIIGSKLSLSDQVLINHERIHLRQQIELAIILFYIIYLSEFLYRYIKLGDRHRAYKSISFEKEAYFRERDLRYLSNRKLFSWWSYM
jgi:hypothetical protein